MLLKAFAEVSIDFPDWQLVIIGEGSERQSLLNLADALLIKHKVHLPGITSNVESWMARAGLVVQPSRYEGFSNVVLEALGMGCTVISSDCSGARDLIDDGVSGSIVPVNDIKSLVSEMNDLMRNRLLREQYGMAGLMVRHKYSYTNVMTLWESLIQSTVVK